jgi:hypothetical protein
VIVAIANIATLPGFFVSIRTADQNGKVPPGTPISWQSALFQLLVDIVFDFPCYAWSITETEGDEMDWPYIINATVSTFNFILRAVKTRTPSRVRRAVIDAGLGIAYLIADAGYFIRLEKAKSSDIAALVSGGFVSASVLLEVSVAVGEKLPNPVVQAAAEIAAGVECLCQVGYTSSAIVTAQYTIKEMSS